MSGVNLAFGSRSRRAMTAPRFYSVCDKSLMSILCHLANMKGNEMCLLSFFLGAGAAYLSIVLLVLFRYYQVLTGRP